MAAEDLAPAGVTLGPGPTAEAPDVATSGDLPEVSYRFPLSVRGRSGPVGRKAATGSDPGSSPRRRPGWRYGP